MSWSLTYNSIDLSTYGLIIAGPSVALSQLLSADSLQLADRGYASRSLLPPKTMSIPIYVQASTEAYLKSYIDAIKRICGEREEKELIFDFLDDRYWMARLEGLNGRLVGPLTFQGTLVFVADDPLAYSTSETSSDHNVDADPDTIQETPGGTAYIKPVYTLTAGENLSGITLLVENIALEEELQWEGSLAITEELEIDVVHFTVKKEGVEDMANVSGQFPRLIPNVVNYIKVTDFSNTGTLNITYRDTYY